MTNSLDPRDGLGCSSHSLATDVEIRRSDMRFYRKAVTSQGISEVYMPGCDRGFLIGVSQTAAHRRNIYKGRNRTDYGFAASDIYLRNFEKDYRAEIDGPFDFILLELSNTYLRQIAEEMHLPSLAGLCEQTAKDDPVLSNLVRALAPTLDRPQDVHTIFVEQLSMAIGIHLVHHYGGSGPLAARVNPSGLSPRLEARAKDYLDANCHRDVSIGDVAAVCSMSRGYFIRAFRESTGVTPYKWLVTRRVEKARNLIETTDLPLAEIATACGFSDQSHLSRHFVQVVGLTPGRLRRRLPDLM